MGVSDYYRRRWYVGKHSVEERGRGSVRGWLQEGSLGECRLARESTFCSIARLVVFGEPLQILVFNPRNPVLVLAVVELANLLFVCFGLRFLDVVCHDAKFSFLYVQ